jgi:site-specific DNA-methyltransferase (cytosine-N4-specific)
MVEMWDGFFAGQSATTYDEMHAYLGQVWHELRRVLVSGGIACINIGDATRSQNGIFRLYANHSRIIESFERLGFVTLPYLLWKKPTTKPHYKGKAAFLGSGFLPPNAYVTIDMEYILIFRKGPRRKFEPKDVTRYTSRYEKKERDEWFSQVWNIKGVRQGLDGFERRIAAFPEEIPRRLIRMFSIIGDTIIDPFLGSGTTLKAAIALGRKCTGYEKLPELNQIIKRTLGSDSLKVEFVEDPRNYQ